jgi:peroxin-3
LRRRFEQNQDDCTYTVLALLPTVRDEIVAALPVEQISEQLQQERQERLRRIGASEAGSSEFPSAAPSTVGDDGKSLTESFLHTSQIGSSNPDITAARPRRSKAQLWQDMKINSIARALTLVYTLCLLTLLTRIQLNLLGRRTYLSSVVALASPPNPAHASRISLENHDDDNYDNAYGNDFETNRKYLTFSWWLLHRGSREIMARVMAAVKEVFAQVNIREDVSLESLGGLIMRVRKIVEGSTEEERRSTKWLGYLLPPAEDECFVIRQSGTSDHSGDDAYASPERSPLHEPAAAAAAPVEDLAALINPSLRRLLDETADLIDSPTFSFVLTRVLDAAHSHLIDHRIAIEAFHAAPPAPPLDPEAPLHAQPRITELPTATCKLAHILPAFCKQAHAIAVGSGELESTLAGVAAQGANGLALGNEYLAAVDRVPDLAAFAALVYSSNWEYEPLEFAGQQQQQQQQQNLSRGPGVVPAAGEAPQSAAEARLQREVDDDEEMEIIEMVHQAAACRQHQQQQQQQQEQELALQQGFDEAQAALVQQEESAILVPHPPQSTREQQQEEEASPLGEKARNVAGEATQELEKAWRKATAAATSAAELVEEHARAAVDEVRESKAEDVVVQARQLQQQQQVPVPSTREFSDPETAVPPPLLPPPSSSLSSSDPPAASSSPSPLPSSSTTTTKTIPADPSTTSPAAPPAAPTASSSTTTTTTKNPLPQTGPHPEEPANANANANANAGGEIREEPNEEPTAVLEGATLQPPPASTSTPIFPEGIPAEIVEADAAGGGDVQTLPEK